MLNYIYNSIGFKYDLIKTKDTVKTQPTKKELIKDKLNKFVNQIQTEIPLEKKSMIGELYIKEKFDIKSLCRSFYECSY